MHYTDDVAVAICNGIVDFIEYEDFGHNADLVCAELHDKPIRYAN